MESLLFKTGKTFDSGINRVKINRRSVFRNSTEFSSEVRFSDPYRCLRRNQFTFIIKSLSQFGLRCPERFEDFLTEGYTSQGTGTDNSSTSICGTVRIITRSLEEL